MKKLFQFGIGLSCFMLFSSTLAGNTAATSDLQKILNNAVTFNAIAGAVLSISSPALGTITVASGYSDRATRTAMNIDNNFRIASMSKTFLAITILKLSEEGKLNLDAKIASYLPNSIDLKRIANGEQVTVRQLLQMRSGIPNYTDTNTYLNNIGKLPEEYWTPSNVISFIYDKPATALPGTTYEYCNTNYVLLQSIIEHLTGTILSSQERKYIFDPINLKNTYGEIQEKRFPGFYGLITHGYDILDNKVTDVTTYNDGFGLGDGNLVSTATDMTRFVRALLENQKILSNDLLQQMLTIKDDYGLGIFYKTINGQTAWSHSGHSSGFSGEYYYLPDKKISIVILTNDANSEFFDDIASKALTIIEH